MAELELVRVAQDGASLVLRDPGGTLHTLAITEALRAAVTPAPGSPTSATSTAPGSATPRTSVADAAGQGATAPPARGHETPLRPRDLQARLRAGATAQELAELSGLPLESVQRYEWPVITEREHVIGAVRGHDVAGLDSTRELGEVADARLAARGVTPQDATWTARREGSAPWVVEVRFLAGDRERSARWTFDLRGRLVTPLDDEARWLSQPDDPLSPDVRAVPSLTTRRATTPADDETALLLDDLAGRRGHRSPGRTHRPPTSSLPVVASRTPAPAAGSHDGDGGFEMVPLGALPVDDRAARGHRGSRPSPAAHTTDDTEATDNDTDASVIDIGRWNPRQPRTRSLAATDDGPGATRPALTTGAGTAVEAPHDTPGDREVPDPPGAKRAQSPARPGSPATRRKGRAQVPSWDEIVFGARPEPG